MRRVVTMPYFAVSASTCSISEGWALSPSMSIAIGRLRDSAIDAVTCVRDSGTVPVGGGE